MGHDGLLIEIRGTIQGVGYRPWVHQLAARIGVTGSVRNDSSGVSIEAFGAPDALDRFLTELQDGAPPAARVRSVQWTHIPAETRDEFVIASSAVTAGSRVSIPADLATCPDCLRELFDSADRRYRYPFINCTNCGPRYSIVTGAPYDRAKTAMAPFAMCEECTREYESPFNRRFHAQPNACRVCGPKVIATSPRREPIETSDPIRFAARAVRAGLTVAIKGLGGFHLACDATQRSAVRRLRERKQRESRPFAVMVADLAAAELLADLTPAERKLLTSNERPIVLARRRENAAISEVVCGDTPLIGIFLPYTPLHHLLLRDAGRPLVMTSGNIAGEPMVTTNEAAIEQLNGVADLFLFHDRDIITRVDDSIVRVIADAPIVLRRARGFVPRSIEVERPFIEPLLACGAHLKNAFCLASGTSVFLGPHIGDLESVDAMRAYEMAVARMKEFTGIRPSVLAHDLHPDYFTTHYALARQRVRTIGVQHHHAHIAAVMAEHGLDGPVIGIAYDGAGFGTDGTSWGGEILIADYEGFDRFATFRPIPLAGGDQAIREPWRIALALLDESFNGEPPLYAIPLFRDLPPQVIEAIRRMIARNLHTIPARGAGRYFDAFGSLVLGVPGARYEGDVAIRWNLVADANEYGRYPVVIRDGSSPWELDMRPMVRAVVDDLLAGRDASTISARFHNTIAAATIELARAALLTRGQLPVVLGGGCFQNARLTEAIFDGLRGLARVYINRDVPPGDGGIALGQALIANAQLRASRLRSGAEVAVCV